MRLALIAANKLLRPFGLKLVRSHHDRLYYQHDYGAGGYDAYRRSQVAANRRKLDRIWADERTLEAIAGDAEARGLRNGLCHGARNGYEVRWFVDRLQGEVLGTDISPTADRFAGMVVHDFHEPRADWAGRWDFIYTNSLDQAFDPEMALAAWAGQLRPGGRIYIEHTMAHSPTGASEMDPFGAHPMAVPYLLFQWGRGRYRLDDILELADVGDKGKVWIFVIAPEAGRAALAAVPPGGKGDAADLKRQAG